MLYQVLSKNVIRKRLFILLLLAVLSFILFISLFVQHKTAVCFFTNHPTDQKTITDILEVKTQPSYGRNVFFHETSCSLDNIIKINARQACAIESAGK